MSDIEMRSMCMWLHRPKLVQKNGGVGATKKWRVKWHRMRRSVEVNRTLIRTHPLWSLRNGMEQFILNILGELGLTDGLENFQRIEPQMC